MAKIINHRGHGGHREALLFSLCSSVFSVVFRTSPEDNKKSHNILGADETINTCLLFFQTRINTDLHGCYLKSISDKITGKLDRAV